MKKLLTLFTILVSAQFVLAGDTPIHIPFPHGYHPGKAIHHHKGFAHPMQHRNVFLFSPWHAPMHVSITVPGVKAADAEMERNSLADMVSISIPSFEMADAAMNPFTHVRITVDTDYTNTDAEMNPLADARISVNADYIIADEEMEFNRAADLTSISIPGFQAADAEISGLADARIAGSNL
jgi:hypothetical protein